MALAHDRSLPSEALRGGVTLSEQAAVQTVVEANGEAVFDREVPVELRRLQPRSIGGYSFWRMEVAVDPEHQRHITSNHVLVIARHPYSALWSCLARFRPGRPGSEGATAPLELPRSVGSLESLQAYIDHELEYDPWETGDRLVAGISLPASAFDVRHTSPWGDGYLLGACIDPLGLEHTILSALRVKPLVRWADAGYFSPASSLAAESELTARRHILLQIGTRLALAGPAQVEELDSREVLRLAASILGDLQADYDADLLELEGSLSLVGRASRRFHVDLPFALGQMQSAAEGKGRLMYKCTAPNVLTPAYAPMPPPIEDGQVLTQLRSLTLCCTDVSNLRGVLGHGHGDERVLGHENCNLVLESKVPRGPPGSIHRPAR